MRSFILLAILPAALSASCEGQDLLDNPADPAAAGPYPVGVRNVSPLNVNGREIKAEIWYPAQLGSEQGKNTVEYDARDEVPPRQQDALVGDIYEIGTNQSSDAFEGLPLADGGPFPIAMFVHGTAGWKSASVNQQAHWASRGFVVIAASHPGIQLYDLLNLVNVVLPPNTDQAGDARGMLSALANITEFPQLEFLAGRVDNSRVGVAGHSAGASSLSRMGDVADVLMPLAGAGAINQVEGSRVKSVVMVAGVNDSVVPASRAYNGYLNTQSFVSKRFVSVGNIGHLFCTDLCKIGDTKGGIAQIAVDAGIRAAAAFRGLSEDGCEYMNGDTGPFFVSPECGWLATNYVTSAALEEVLRCDARMTGALANSGEALNGVPECNAGSKLIEQYEEELL